MNRLRAVRMWHSSLKNRSSNLWLENIRELDIDLAASKMTISQIQKSLKLLNLCENILADSFAERVEVSKKKKTKKSEEKIIKIPVIEM